MSKMAIRTAFILTMMYALVSLYRIIVSEAPDFTVYYRSARNLATGSLVYGQSGMYTGLGYPPVSLLPFLPLTLLPEQPAQGLFVIGSFLAIPAVVLLSLFLSGVAVNMSMLMVAVTAVFWSFPVRFTLGMGQSTLLALFFLLFSMYRREGVSAALSLTTALILKPHFGLLLPFLIISGRKKPVILALGITAVLAGITYLARPDLWIRYLAVEVPALSEFRDRSIYYNQGLGAFFSRIAPEGIARAVSNWVSALVYLAALYAGWKRPGGAFAIGILALLLTEPLSWQHHYVILIPVYAWWFARFRKGSGFLIPVLVIISYLLVSLNLKTAAQKEAHWLVSSHVFWGTACLFVVTWHQLMYGKKS